MYGHRCRRARCIRPCNAVVIVCDARHVSKTIVYDPMKAIRLFWGRVYDTMDALEISYLLTGYKFDWTIVFQCYKYKTNRIRFSKYRKYHCSSTGFLSCTKRWFDRVCLAKGKPGWTRPLPPLNVLMIASFPNMQNTIIRYYFSIWKGFLFGLN